ncbi:hypothetical protein M8J75_012256 [Diaphorina citri]|nr:hypothetical protein M8J75_012256 [Diaphorina citri]
MINNSDTVSSDCVPHFAAQQPPSQPLGIIPPPTTSIPLPSSFFPPPSCKYLPVSLPPLSFYNVPHLATPTTSPFRLTTKPPNHPLPDPKPPPSTTYPPPRYVGARVCYSQQPRQRGRALGAG